MDETDEDQVERVAEALLNKYRERQGVPPSTLEAMREDHREEWIEDARAALAAIHPKPMHCARP